MERSLSLWTKMKANTELYTQPDCPSSFVPAWSQQVCPVSVLCQKATGESPPPNRSINKKWATHDLPWRRGKVLPRMTIRESSGGGGHQERGRQVQVGGAQEEHKRRGCWQRSSPCPKTLQHLSKVINSTKMRKSVKKDKDKSCHKLRIQLWTEAKDENRGTSQNNTVKGLRSKQFGKENRDLQGIVCQQQNVKKSCV